MLTNKVFNFTIKTDGYSVCIVLKQFKVYLKQLKRQKISKPQILLPNSDAYQEERQLNSEIKYIVGVDPGRKNYLTAVRRNIVTGKEDSFVFTTKKYYHDCGFNKSKKWIKKKLRKIEKWQSELPSIKTIYSEDVVKLMTCLHNSKEFEWWKEVKFKEKLKRFKFTNHILKQRTINEMCKGLLFDGTKENTLIAYGDGNFNTSFGHRKASPKATLISDKCKEMGYNLETINEFNTSKACSKCLSELTSLRQTNVKKYFNVSDHFVKSCPTCRTRWNRDINSSRHMINLSLFKNRPKTLRISFKVLKTTLKSGETPE
jgi:hypothetical protein